MDWALWMIVLSGAASLVEIQTGWSIDDVMEAVDVLEYREALQEEEYERLKQGG